LPGIVKVPLNSGAFTVSADKLFGEDAIAGDLVFVGVNAVLSALGTFHCGLIQAAFFRLFSARFNRLVRRTSWSLGCVNSLCHDFTSLSMDDQPDN
jgi:hypothetical protein